MAARAWAPGAFRPGTPLRFASAPFEPRLRVLLQLQTPGKSPSPSEHRGPSALHGSPATWAPRQRLWVG